ncbi:hypothetical protein GCK72_007126 [Caenorhabditis remanei]|uniref:Uncharacterized protein n=1 Tax=Caenorhabditis remanei TaxID=31234 RepID=A0A6A5HKT5_CAERE|nr:hypothetical protein GCK72_007126 [Caenorhabditis remanei]KAF1767167.1 hypothetical protein GCK72_007126 [Caenorhabditis remanei]
MLSAVASTSSLIQFSTSSPLASQRKISEISNPTESLYRKWSHVGTPPRSSTSTMIAGNGSSNHQKGVLQSTLSMSAKDRARKFSEKIASWVSMSICE